MDFKKLFEAQKELDTHIEKEHPALPKWEIKRGFMAARYRSRIQRMYACFKNERYFNF